MAMYEPGLAAQASLAATWTRFEQLSARLARYLKTSEEEFAHLIGALDDCWSMAETVQKANAHLAGLSTVESDNESFAIRNSMLDGCRVFRGFLDNYRFAQRVCGANQARRHEWSSRGCDRQLQSRPSRWLRQFHRHDHHHFRDAPREL